MKSMRCLIVAAAALASSSAHAQITDGVVKIGVLTDMSSLYADLGGRGLGRGGEDGGRGFRPGQPRA